LLNAPASRTIHFGLRATASGQTKHRLQQNLFRQNRPRDNQIGYQLEPKFPKSNPNCIVAHSLAGLIGSHSSAATNLDVVAVSIGPLQSAAGMLESFFIQATHKIFQR
jgi:hypothetical protein